MDNSKQKLKNKNIEEQTKKEINELMKDQNFYIWLNEITRKMPILATVEDLNISDDDYKNLKKLSTLNKVISDYAKRKKIYSTFFDKGYGFYYFIINNEIPYEIGLGILNDNLVYFCSRCELNNKNTFIDLDDIKKDYFKKQIDQIEADKNDLKKLKNSVLKLLDRGISYNDISSCLEKANEQHKKKQLLKKD